MSLLFSVWERVHDLEKGGGRARQSEALVSRPGLWGFLGHTPGDPEADIGTGGSLALPVSPQEVCPSPLDLNPIVCCYRRCGDAAVDPRGASSTCRLDVLVGRWPSCRRPLSGLQAGGFQGVGIHLKGTALVSLPSHLYMTYTRYMVYTACTVPRMDELQKALKVCTVALHDWRRHPNIFVYLYWFVPFRNSSCTGRSSVVPARHGKVREKPISSY